MSVFIPDNSLEFEDDFKEQYINYNQNIDSEQEEIQHGIGDILGSRLYQYKNKGPGA